MKIRFKSTIWLLVLMLIIVSNSNLSAQSQEVIIQTTAQCQECKENIEKALMQEKGVKYAELDIESKKAKVIYNPKRTNPETLRKVISLTGYDADEIPADSAAVLRLNPCCTKDGHRDD
jgi:periplasmic mercuric ion binding protein